MDGVERAVPGPVPEDVASTIDARGDAAAHVLATRPRMLGTDPSLELRPVDEVEHRLAAEPPGHPGGQSAQRHRLLGHHMEARSDGSGSSEREFKRLCDVVGVDVMEYA